MRSREDITTDVDDISKGEEKRGKLDRQDSGEDTLKSVIENDEKRVESGKLLSEAINQNFSSFNPDMMMDNLKKDFSLAENIYGESIFRLISGYNPDYIKKNINIPEFQRELLSRMKKKLEEMRMDGLVSRHGVIQEKGIELASIVMFMEELDNLNPKGLIGEKTTKKISHYGEKADTKNYSKGERYRNIDLRKSVKVALRRGHKELTIDDLRVNEREAKGSVYIVYAIDASGSMKGKKIEMAKKAGIALAYKAISSRDKVGLITFNTEVNEVVFPTLDFKNIIKKITGVRASKETNLTETLEKAIKLFPNTKITKHIIILSDAMPTIGKNPEEEALKVISRARNQGITISLIGIDLDKKAKEFAEKIVKVGNGKLYVVKKAERLDMIVLEDYYSLG